MTPITIRLATQLTASDAMAGGIHEAAASAAYELLAARLGIGPDDELEGAAGDAQEQLAEQAAAAGVDAAARAILRVLMRSAPDT